MESLHGGDLFTYLEKR